MGFSSREQNGKRDSVPLDNESVTWSDESGEIREKWSGKMNFLFSCIGYAVGLGNVWRFPYLAYKNGGGAFLVPYLIFLAICGMPLTMLEMTLGQFSSLGPTTIFQRLCPLFEGLGWCQVLVSGLCCVYYNVIIAWTLYYLFLSMRASLPWATCGNWWNTEGCVSGVGQLNGSNQSVMTASEEFWRKYVLDISDGIDDIGTIRWELFLALVAAWFLIFACLCKGVQVSGKVVYFTATFPYVVLFILMVRAVLLPGAQDGVLFYFIPRWHKLLEVKVWLAAASQIFYSVGAVWGALFTFASFNKFDHNCYKTAMLIPVINCATSIFAGIVVFAIIGNMAYMAGTDIDKVITSGPGLAFFVYPEALANLPVSPLWSVMFFLMLLTVGFDTQFGMFETVLTAFMDTWPRQLRANKVKFTGAMSVFMLILGIPCITQGGMYVLQLLDWYSATFSLMLVAVIESLLVSWNYGVRRFMADMHLMVGRYPFAFFPVCWAVCTPLLVVSLLLANFWSHTNVTYDTYTYPDWAVTLGWFLAWLGMVPLPGFAIYNLFFTRKNMTFSERLRDCLRPTPDWGPADQNDRFAYRKSLNTVASKQLFVRGTEDPLLI